MATHEADHSSVSRNDNKWRENIISQLHERNKIQTSCFSELITLHNRLFENVNTLRGQNMQLTIANETLRRETGNVSPGTNVNSVHEVRLFKQTEELTALHRKNAEQMQEIVDLNKKAREMVKDLHAKDASLAECMETNNSLRLEITKYINREREYETINQMLKDEHQALQIAFESLENKLRKAQEENRQLIERLKKYKERDAEKLNEENDNFLNESFTSPTAFLMHTISKFGKRQAKMQKELEDAARDTRSVSPDRSSLKEGVAGLPTTVPTKVSVTFSAHEGEVYAVKWSPVDRILATGGADRKVKLWSVIKGTFESKGMLVGSNAGVMSVDFDSTGTLILGASNDYASRVWTVSDLRMKHTLTGHCGKVMAAKFLGEPSKVVTGSHDRTLKIWDLRNKACIETKFAGSSCNDLVTSDGAGSTIISGHFDQKIRFWDTRAESSSNDLLLEGKVTSLDLSRDANYLLSCVRDDTVKLIDLRMKKIIGSFSADSFKVGFDWTRATFSPDGQYIAAGSSDGSVFIWSIATNMVETVLKNHSVAVIAVSWHPHGTFLASVDRAKTVTVWGDHV